MEIIDGQCPCGQAVRALIFEDGGLRWYAKMPRLLTLVGIRRCPACNRDLSKITAEQLKENAWPS